MSLTNLTLKRVSDFHGHLCPNLVIGYRASQLGLNTLGAESTKQETLSVIVENNTSAVDALQYLTGCTIGNQHLRIRDFGKHKYIFVLNQSRRAVIVNLKKAEFGEETSFFDLEKKLKDNRASIGDIEKIQYLLDQWVSWLLSLSDQELFSVQETSCIPPGIDLSSRYLRCSRCGDLVEESKAVSIQEDLVCYPCSRFIAQNSETRIVK